MWQPVCTLYQCGGQVISMHSIGKFQLDLGESCVQQYITAVVDHTLLCPSV